MGQMQILNAIGETTLWTDILFVTNRENLLPQISTQLNDKDFSWSKVAMHKCPRNASELDYIGTVVIDTAEIKRTQRNILRDTIDCLEAADISCIILNNQIDLCLDGLELTETLQTASLEEMWGRVAANVAYRKRLNKINQARKHEQHNVPQDTMDQLRMAAEVQKNFLPGELPNSDKVLWATVYRPADWVSGDIYDVSRLDENHIGFYIADAVGHSMPAALLTMFLKQAFVLRQTVGHKYQIFEPVDVIQNVNNKMVAQGLAGCLFATACYCLLNTETLELKWARAGHPYPVLIRKGQKLVQLEGRGALLGVFEDAQFEQGSIQLQSTDKLFLYSDGGESLVGECEDNSKFLFTEEFCGICNLPIENMLGRFNDMAKQRTVPKAEIDDVTALGLEIL